MPWLLELTFFFVQVQYYWAVDPFRVDLVGVDPLGVDLVGVDLVGVDLVGGHQYFQLHPY